jgi:hypothetical protein
MIRTILLSLALTACATDTTTSAPAPTGVTWTIYTHASCNATTTNIAHTLCATPSTRDAYEPGQADAGDFADAWLADCQATQGLIDTDKQGDLCLTSDGQPSPWRCSANAQPTFEACQ